MLKYKLTWYRAGKPPPFSLDHNDWTTQLGSGGGFTGYVPVGRGNFGAPYERYVWALPASPYAWNDFLWEVHNPSDLGRPISPVFPNLWDANPVGQSDVSDDSSFEKIAVELDSAKTIWYGITYSGGGFPPSVGWFSTTSPIGPSSVRGAKYLETGMMLTNLESATMWIPSSRFDPAAPPFGSGETVPSWDVFVPSGSPPPARGYAAMPMIGSGGNYIFGGVTAGDVYLNDLWQFDQLSGSWIPYTVSGSVFPPGRKSAVIESVNAFPAPRAVPVQAFLVFGGADGSGLLTDAWALRQADSKWYPVEIAGDVPVPTSPCASSTSAGLGLPGQFVGGGITNCIVLQGGGLDDIYVGQLSVSVGGPPPPLRFKQRDDVRGVRQKKGYRSVASQYSVRTGRHNTYT
jgi:hypothetical protein